MSTEVVADEPNAVLVATVDHSRFEALYGMVQRLKLEASLEDGDRGDAIDFQMSIVEAILSGETEEEIFQSQEAGGTSGQDFVNRPFRVIADDITFVQTGIKSSTTFPFYVRMRVVEVATGEEDTITCGGFTIVPVLFALREKGFINNEVPKALSFKATQTRTGNTRLTLVPFTEPKPKTKASAK